MKKYNLYLKEEYRGKEAIKYPEITGHKILGKSKYHYILVGNFLKMDLSSNLKHEAIVFTQQGIDNLPHGFVKLFDVIKVKEELYYIKMPHGDGVYLKENKINGKVIYGLEEEYGLFLTKFTLEHIEETYPEYKQFAVKVEEIDNE